MNTNGIVVIETPAGGKRQLSVRNGIVGEVVCGDCCRQRGITSARKGRAEGLFYEYKDGLVVCPRCGRQLIVLKTALEAERELKEAALEAERAAKEAALEAERLANLQVYEASWDLSTGIKFYGLTARVGPDVWKKISGYFKYYNSGWSDYDDADFSCSAEPSGWLTTQPDEVEKILIEEGLIKSENSRAAREAAAKEAEKKASRAADEKLAAQKKANELKGELRKAFEDKKYIETAEYEQQSLDEFESGEVLKIYEDALEDRTSYSGGVFYLVCENKIWMILTNDNWMMHNVKFDFDGRAFKGEGYCISYSAETADLIEEYCSFAEKAKGL